MGPNAGLAARILRTFVTVVVLTMLAATNGCAAAGSPSATSVAKGSATPSERTVSIAPTASLPELGGTWAAGPPLPTPRGEVAAAVLDGRLYVAGGFGDPRGSHSRAFEAFDPATSSWKELALLPEGRDHAALTALDSRLYLTGGNTEVFAARANLWIYDPAADRWSAGPLMPDRRSAHAAVGVDGRLYVVGGVIPSRTFEDPTWRYDPASGIWDAGLAPPPTYREHLAAVTVDGTIIAIGGRSATDLAAVERYDPATDSWTRLPPLPTARGGLTASVLGGAIHVVGGESIDSPRVFARHEVFDLATLTWAIGPPLSRGRHGVGSGAIDGLLYVAAGGSNPDLSISDKLDVFTP